MTEKIKSGHRLPCVGFTLNIENVFRVLRHRRDLNLKSVRETLTEVLVASQQGCLSERMTLCAKLWESSIKVHCVLCTLASFRLVI